MPTIGGGFTLPDIGRAPRIVQPVDPLERAIKQAQLYNLQQDTGLRQRQLTLQQLGLEHNQENDKAMRRLQEAGLLENIRHNKSEEGYQTGVLGETTRHNIAGEGVQRGELAETTRYHDLTVQDSREGHKTAVTTALINNLLNDPRPEAHALAASTLTKLGYPELEQALNSKPVDNKKQEGRDLVTKPITPTDQPKSGILKLLKLAGTGGGSYLNDYAHN